MISRPRRAPGRDPERSGERPPRGQWVLTTVVVMLLVSDVIGVAAGASLDIGDQNPISSSDPDSVTLETRLQTETGGLPLVESTGLIQGLAIVSERKNGPEAKGSNGGKNGNVAPSDNRQRREKRGAKKAGSSNEDRKDENIGEKDAEKKTKTKNKDGNDPADGDDSSGDGSQTNGDASATSTKAEASQPSEEPGTFDIGFDAADFDGNHSTTESVPVNSDDTPPSVEPLPTTYKLGHPPATDGETVTVAAEVTDDDSGVRNVTVDASEINLGPTNGSIPLTRVSIDRWVASIDVDRVPDPGLVELPITAYDNNTNVNDDEVVTVIVAPVANPVVIPNETKYPSGQTVAGRGQLVVISADVFMQGGQLSSVTIDATTVNDSSTPVQLTNVGGDRWEANITIDDGDGTKHLPITATAKNGHYHTAPVEVRVDTTPPSVVPLETDCPGSQSSASTGQMVTVAANVTDNFAGVRTVRVNASSINTSADNDTIALTRVPGMDRYAAEIIVDTNSIGTFALPITATDNATNVNDTESVSVSITEDGGPVGSDTVSIVPLGTDYPGSQSAAKPGQTVTVSVNATSTAGEVTDVTVNASAINTSAGSDTLALSQVAGDSWEATFTIDRGDDVFALPVTANDTDDNRNEAESVEVIVDSTPPSVVPLETTYPVGPSNASVGEAVTVAVTASDVGAGLVGVTVNASSINDSSGPIELANVLDKRWEASITVDHGSGSETLPVTATDNATNVNDTEAVTVEVAEDGGPVGSDVVSVEPHETDYPGSQSAATVGQTVTVAVNATSSAGDVTNVTVNASAINTSSTNASIAMTNVTGDRWEATITIDRGDDIYALPVTAVDADDNRNETESVEVIVDSTPPSVVPLETTYPGGTQPASLGETVTVAVEATDALSGLEAVTVNASAINTSTTNTSIPLSPAAGDRWEAEVTIDRGSGTIQLRVTAIDNATNVNAAESVTVEIETGGTGAAAPAVSPLETGYPTPQTAVRPGQTVTVGAVVNDSDGDLDSVTVNASAINTSTQNASIALQNVAGTDVWNTTLEIDRGHDTYQLSINATDVAGNSNTTESLEVVVDAVEPAVEPLETTYPDDQPAATHGQSVTVSATVTDDFSGVSNVTVNASLVNTSVSNASIPMTRSTGETWTATVGIDRGHGTFDLPIMAVDNASNTNDTATVDVRIDSKPPAVVPRDTTYPSGQSVAGLGQEVRVSANVTDPDSGVFRVSVNASAINTSSSSSDISLTHVGGDRWAGNVTVDRNDGSFALPITATDNATNVNATEFVTVEVDTTGPTISEVVVSGTDPNRIDIAFNTSEPVPRINVTVTGPQTRILTASDFTRTGDRYSTTVTGLQPGDYTVDIVRVVDDAGNVNESLGSPIKVTINPIGGSSGVSTTDRSGDDDPRVTVLAPDPGDYLRGGSITLVEWLIARTNGLTFTISVAVDTGDGYRTVASGLDDTGSYSWRVPVVDAASTTLRVTAHSGSRRFIDTVDRPFAIDATPPTARATVPETATLGEPITVSAAQSTDAIGIASYAWRFGDDSTARGAVATHTYDRPGTYVIRLTVEDHVGHRATALRLIDVEETTPSTPAETTTPPSPEPGEPLTPTGGPPTPASPGPPIEPAGANPFATAIAILLLAGGTLWLVAWRRNWI